MRSKAWTVSPHLYVRNGRKVSSAELPLHLDHARAVNHLDTQWVVLYDGWVDELCEDLRWSTLELQRHVDKLFQKKPSLTTRIKEHVSKQGVKIAKRAGLEEDHRLVSFVSKQLMSADSKNPPKHPMTDEEYIERALYLAKELNQLIPFRDKGFDLLRERFHDLLTLERKLDPDESALVCKLWTYQPDKKVRIPTQGSQRRLKPRQYWISGSERERKEKDIQTLLATHHNHSEILKRHASPDAEKLRKAYCTTFRQAVNVDFVYTSLGLAPLFSSQAHHTVQEKPKTSSFSSSGRSEGSLDKPFR